MTAGRIPSIEGGIQPTIFDAKADLLTATANDTPARLAVGTNNQVVMADSAQATGLKYANEATATLTTTGDTLYASGANTLARRAIGTTGQVLTVSGGVPTWATPAGSSLTISEVATGTISSTIKLQITGLSSYDNIFFKIKSVNTSGNVAYPNMTINDNSTSGYFEYSTSNESNNTNSNNYNMSYDNAAKIYQTYNPMGTGSTDNYFFLVLTNCKSTGFTYFTYGNYYLTSTASLYKTQAGSGVFASAAAVSSIEFLNDGGGSALFTGGNYKVWAG